ncbi:hypothetical protein HDZ31DRAFT_43446 [Schizophyllum fasciatum]
MRRSQSRAASPTPTAFSGISNYKTESYRPIGKDKNAPAVPQIDYRTVSKIHFDELSSYLAAYLARSSQDSRSTARQKLTRLTIQQFHELSTDVYDELVRRKSEKQVPFLPVREEFHPKRNQARQKLATLPTSRFEDLSSDVYYELARRYPEFKEDVSREPDSRASEDRPSDSGYGSGSRRPSEDRRRPSEATYSISSRQSEDVYRGRKPSEDQGPPLSRSAMSHNYSGSVASSRRRPSQDGGRRSEDRGGADIARRPSGMTSTSGASESASSTMQSATATSQMIIPTKSTIEEEYIEVPYAREARESGSTTIDDREPSRERGDLLDEPDSASDYRGSTSPAVGGLSGLSGLSARLRDTDDDDDDLGRRSGDDFYNKGRASAQSDRSGAGRFGGRSSVADDTEKMRRDYEYKIATMQSQMSNMQRDLDSAGAREQRRGADDDRVRQLEDQLEQMRRKSEAQTNRMHELEDDLDSLRRERDRRERDKVSDEEELQILRDRCERLEEEREARGTGGGGGGADPEIIDQLRSDMEGLMAELEDLQRRNDELMAAKDSDLSVIRELDSQLKEYKRKYEQAKTELRSVKATSQLYAQAPRLDRSAEELPVTADGGILDVHITAFLSSVDGLLTAGRSNAPTRVLTPMKAVVNAVSAIIEDSRAFERRNPRERSDVDPDTLKALAERLEATLSNLVAAVKTHASSSGMSPVSLLDAAASHVSATVTELARTVLIRRATKQEQEQFAAASPPARTAFSPMLRSVEERSMHSRGGSAASSGRARGFGRATPSGNSSSEHTSSPPPIFDMPNGGGNVASDESATGAEDPWAELKAQTESIVYAIQSVLSGVRSPTPSPTLNENITQIITIVSSIVAVCNDNLPPASSAQGKEILRELGEHANKLSEVQALPEVTKESRQIMAKSSFAVANAMKGLMKL